MIFLGAEQRDKREINLTKTGDFLQKDDPFQTDGGNLISKNILLYIGTFSLAYS